MNNKIPKNVEKEVQFNNFEDALNYFKNLCGNDLLFFNDFRMDNEKISEFRYLLDPDKYNAYRSYRHAARKLRVYNIVNERCKKRGKSAFWILLTITSLTGIYRFSRDCVSKMLANLVLFITVVLSICDECPV